MPPPSYGQRKLLCWHYVGYVPFPDVPVPSSTFLLRTNTEQISMTFGGGNHYHQRTNRLHFGQNCTRDKEAGYDRIFESTSNRCCRVANDFTNFKYSYTTPCIRVWRVQYTRAPLKPSSYDSGLSVARISSFWCNFAPAGLISHVLASI